LNIDKIAGQSGRTQCEMLGLDSWPVAKGPNVAEGR
jgi:hypothetical protein